MDKKNIIFILLATLLSFTSCKKDEAGILLEDDTNVYGYVKDDKENPIPGVVVSDGVKCVVTDNDGSYQMKVATGTRRVYISVPSGYEIPMNNGLPKIYNNFVLVKDKPVKSDFILKKGQDSNDFTLFTLADVQLLNSNSCTQLSEEIMPYLLKASSELLGPVIGLSLGDMVWDKMDYLQNEYPKQIRKFGFPIFHVIGNHDYDVTATTLETSDDIFESVFGPVNWSFNYGQCHFVGFSNIGYKPGDKAGYDRAISDETLSWLKEDLSYVSKDKLIIVSMHTPSQRRYVGNELTDYLKGSNKLYELLDGYKVLILTGHLHHNYTFDISEDIVEYNHGSLMGNHWDNNPQGICNDGSPRGFTVYEIKGNKLANKYYQGALNDKEYQMELYSPGQYDSNVGKENFTSVSVGDMVINVFNWHTDWTVTVNEDGNESFLPSIKLQDLNAYNSNFEFASDHMFKYTPKSNDWQKITVTVKDSFGNIYSDFLNR